MPTPAFWWKPRLTLPALLLWPLGWAYGVAARFHGNWRARQAYFAAVPVISVGNLVAGGAGKTPIVKALAAHYAAGGWQVAIVMRGYGGRESQRPLQVTPSHTALQVGDEAIELFRALPRHVQVWVGHHRPSVVRRAEQAGARLILLDDGFQRRDVARDIDLLVLNAAPVGKGQYLAPFGNGLCLPAGPLREPLEGRRRADLALIMNEPKLLAYNPPPFYGVTGFRLETAPDAATLAALKGTPLVAFAGIGVPEKFFEMLRSARLRLTTTVAFPDHMRYRPKHLRALQELARESKAKLVTTAKDAVKLPEGFATVVPIQVHGAQWPELLEALSLRTGLALHAPASAD